MLEIEKWYAFFNSETGYIICGQLRGENDNEFVLRSFDSTFVLNKRDYRVFINKENINAGKAVEVF